MSETYEGGAAVYCREHGEVELSAQNYEAQMLDADSGWKCPICEGPAEFIDK